MFLFPNVAHYCEEMIWMFHLLYGFCLRYAILLLLVYLHFLLNVLFIVGIYVGDTELWVAFFRLQIAVRRFLPDSIPAFPLCRGVRYVAVTNN